MKFLLHFKCKFYIGPNSTTLVPKLSGRADPTVLNLSGQQSPYFIFNSFTLLSCA